MSSTMASRLTTQYSRLPHPAPTFQASQSIFFGFLLKFNPFDIAALQ